MKKLSFDRPHYRILLEEGVYRGKADRNHHLYDGQILIADSWNARKGEDNSPLVCRVSNVIQLPHDEDEPYHWNFDMVTYTVVSKYGRKAAIEAAKENRLRRRGGMVDTLD